MGHPPHADNVQFDSVWRDGQQVDREEQVQAAREGAYVLWREEFLGKRRVLMTYHGF